MAFNFLLSFLLLCSSAPAADREDKRMQALLKTLEEKLGHKIWAVSKTCVDDSCKEWELIRDDYYYVSGFGIGSNNDTNYIQFNLEKIIMFGEPLSGVRDWETFYPSRTTIQLRDVFSDSSFSIYYIREEGTSVKYMTVTNNQLSIEGPIAYNDNYRMEFIPIQVKEVSKALGWDE